MPDTSAPRLRRCRPWLGTFVEVTAPAGCEAAVEAGFSAIARVQRLMSFHEDKSDLATLRNAPAGSLVEVAPETVIVLRMAGLLAIRSNGLFDVTVGSRLVSWGFLPTPEGSDARSFCGTSADLTIVDDTHVVCVRPMLIDLGGIAKGYAVDAAVEAMRAAGAENGIVNAGGDLRVFGDQAEIVHLRGASGTIEASLEIHDLALASSSNAHERRHGKEGEASPHVGWKGRPVLTSAAVTVAARQCMIADAMTKIALVDRNMAETMLEALEGTLVQRPKQRTTSNVAS